MAEIIRGVRPGEHQMVLDLWGTVFSGYNWQFYAQYYLRDPWQKNEYTRLCEVDGRFVAAVQLCKRPVETPFGRMIMGGIANVATLTEHRGHGYSSQLLKSCIEIMRQEEFDFSVLYTGINDFYARLGWETVECALMRGSLDPEAKAPAWAPAREENPPAWSEISPVYEAFNARRAIAGVRPPEYASWIMGRLEGCRWVVIREAGKVIAYAVMLPQSGQISIRELGWLPGREDAAKLLAGGIAAQAIEDGAHEIIAIVPADPALVAGFEEAGVHMSFGSYKSAMFQRINMDPEKYDALRAMMAGPEAIIWAVDRF